MCKTYQPQRSDAFVPGRFLLIFILFKFQSRIYNYLIQFAEPVKINRLLRKKAKSDDVKTTRILITDVQRKHIDKIIDAVKNELFNGTKSICKVA